MSILLNVYTLYSLNVKVDKVKEGIYETINTLRDRDSEIIAYSNYLSENMNGIMDDIKHTNRLDPDSKIKKFKQ